MSELPDGWAMTTLGELATEVRNGISAKPSSEDGLPILRISAVRPLKLDTADVRYLPVDFMNAKTYQLAPDDLLFTRYNGNRDLVGACARVDQISHVLVYPDKLIRVRLERTAALPRYIEKAANSQTAREYLDQKLRTSAGQIGVSGADIKAMPLPLPPLPEQKRIADQLDTLLARIQSCNDCLDAIPALLKRFRQAVLGAATFGVLTEEWRDRQVGLPSAVELRHAIEADHVTAGGHERSNASDPTDEAHDLPIEQLPKGWTISTLRDCCRPGRPITYGILKPGPELSEGVPYVRVADFPGNRLNLDSIKRTTPEIDLQYKRARLASGDLLLSIRGSVGRLVVIPPELEGANITQDTARLSISHRLNARYVYYALLSPDAQRRMANAVRGVAVRGINIGDVRALQIPLPSLPEQAEIVRQVDRLFLLADQIEARWNAMRRHAQRLAPQLLSKAFRGELVQQDPNDEPASVLLQRLAKTPTAAAKAPRGGPRSRQAHPSTPQPTVYPDWAALPAGAWAASEYTDEHATAALLIAVLKAWGQPTPQDQARLAAMLCLRPRLFTMALPAHDAATWRRLVGAEAEPLPASVPALQPAVNAHWRRALAGLRARGDLVASGSGPQDTWTLGPGSDRVDTAGWPDGRAGWVVAYLQTHGVEAVLPLLPTAAVDFVHARAA